MGGGGVKLLNTKSLPLYCFKTQDNLNLEIFHSNQKFPDQQKDFLSNIRYIMFFDSDDLLRNDCIEVCISRAKGVDIVWFDYEGFYDGIMEDEKTPTHLETHKYYQECVITAQDWLQRIGELEIKFFAMANMIMIDFQYLINIGLTFQNGIMEEDCLYGVLLFAQARQIAILPEKFYKYRIRPHSTCSHDKIITMDSISPYFASYCKYFKTPLEVKQYHRASSFFIVFLEVIKFLETKPNQLQNKVIEEYFIPTYLGIGLSIVEMRADPLNLIAKFPYIKDKIPQNFRIPSLVKITMKYPTLHPYFRAFYKFKNTIRQCRRILKTWLFHHHKVLH